MAKNDPADDIGLLNSFYGIFLFTGLVLLLVGVPFVFVHKLVTAAIVLLLLAAVMGAWHLSRRGRPQASIMCFGALIWVLVVPLVFLGVKSSVFAILLGIAVMLTVIVSLRAGVIYSSAFMLAWLGHIVLDYFGLAPAPYFEYKAGAAWFVSAMSIWLVLLPITRLIREQRHAFQVVNESESRLQMALAAVSDGVWDYDLRTGKVFRSPTYYALVGRQPEDDAHDFAFFLSTVHPDDLPAVMASIKAHNKGETPFVQVDYRLASPSGELRWLRTRGQVVERAPDGTPWRIVGTLSDITERKRIEDELRENEGRLSRVIHGSDQGFWDWDLSSNVFTVSERFETMLGYAAGEMRLAPENWDEYVPEEDLKLARQSIEDHLAGRTASHELALRCREKQGTWRWVQTRGAIVERDAEGRPLRMSGTHTDINERKRMESELELHRQHLEQLVEERTAELIRAKEIAETASLAKSTFLAKMSHELRTPMNGIMGMTDLALRHATDEAQKMHLRKALRSSQHLLAVISDILDISKIEADRLLLEETDFCLDDVLRNVSDLIEDRARELGLAFAIDSAPGLLEQPFRGDPLRLAQVLLNLTGNAIKFTPQGSITVRVVVLADSGADALLRFEVADTGIGISEEQKGRLFAAFEQADNSTSRKYGGTGLGLSISKSLVHMMGGEIDVDSRLGHGCVVWFTVRLRKSASPAQALAHHAAEPAEAVLLARYRGARILLAEDEPINREVTLAQLEEVGLTVDLAEDGAQALALAGRHAYDLILMDVQMPGMDGLDATRAIRQMNGGRWLPILAMTANAFIEDREACLAAGMDDFLAKPVRPELLFDTLLHWLDRGAAKKANAA